MTSKKYIVCVASVLYMFMMINLALWHGMTKEFFLMNDMNRNGGLKTNPPLTERVHYQSHYTSFSDYAASGKIESFDVVCFGDSFSNGIYNYEDYLVNNYGMKILTANFKAGHCLEEFYMLLNSGVIDEVKPKAVILESVERLVQKRLGRPDFIPSVLTRENVEHLAESAKRTSGTAADISSGMFAPVLVRWNFTYLRNKVQHFLNPEQLSSEVYITKLDRELFTNPGDEDTLLFYYEDLLYLKTPLNAEMVSQNLNTATRLLKAKGIKLIFFAGVDKYDLYYPYILDKKARPENPFFQKMRAVPDKEYIFIDNMKLFREALERGEKDIYWLGDTHWSHKGIKIFCEELVKYILPELR